MREISGNLLDQSPGILCHQVNVYGVMGAGLALQIRRKWPQAHDDYIRRCRKGVQVGDFLVSTIEIGRLYVAHLFGQKAQARSMMFPNDCLTDYGAYPDLLTMVVGAACVHNLPIYIPVGLGCGIAGGDWNTMLTLIKRHAPQAVLVRYGKTV